MKRVIISGTGATIPQAVIGNEELVESYNAFVERENLQRAAEGLEPLPSSSAAFIEHASGIRQRHVHTPDGILDIDRMAPRIAARDDDDLSVLAEFGASAATAAIEDAGVDPASVDLVICASSHLQRMYPAIGIEIQKAVGAQGAAFDLSLGCSSAASGLHVAFNLLRAGAHRRALVVTPELITAHLNFRDRQTHFIFGDAATALLLEAVDDDREVAGRFELVDTRNWTQFSNNIRSNFGYLNRAAEEDASRVPMHDKLIRQQGNKVFKDVTVASHRFIVDFLADHGHTPHTIRRFWLHQANGRMNAMILKLAFGEEVGQDRAPMVLDELGNTAAAGAVVAMHRHHKDMKPGDFGLVCTYGAGYSIGGALVRMM
ncbi:beta-ketoacyl-ACP synthase III [Aquibium sp. ELW1220]|uniref:beta-ketoacyl-ACP synthase III n=1 Tax=Aquibium sp. ELW1220 TaxID=2976766 RepID=UPI0025B1E5FD|nr:beta-ketoacyl-ACP synthase III [Aquibium sp. ELW1220]MDN2583726.1 beta-ketoacyl-ACP synthase III [Aquibium sp. ELW1220]